MAILTTHYAKLLLVIGLIFVALGVFFIFYDNNFRYTTQDTSTTVGGSTITTANVDKTKQTEFWVGIGFASVGTLLFLLGFSQVPTKC